MKNRIQTVFKVYEKINWRSRITVWIFHRHSLLLMKVALWFTGSFLVFPEAQRWEDLAFEQCSRILGYIVDSVIFRSSHSFYSFTLQAPLYWALHWALCWLNTKDYRGEDWYGGQRTLLLSWDWCPANDSLWSMGRYLRQCKKMPSSWEKHPWTFPLLSLCLGWTYLEQT